MLVQKIFDEPKLQAYLCATCEENEVGILFDERVAPSEYIILKIDNYFNENVHPNPAGNDCLIIQHCADAKYKIYLIELKNIYSLRDHSPLQIRSKFQNCFDIFMSDHFRDYFYDLAYEYEIRLLFVVNESRVISDKKQKNTRFDSLLALRPCRFADKLYNIMPQKPYPVLDDCKKD
jgi:hypothetical protein